MKLQKWCKCNTATAKPGSAPVPWPEQDDMEEEDHMEEEEIPSWLTISCWIKCSLFQYFVLVFLLPWFDQMHWYRRNSSER